MNAVTLDLVLVLAVVAAAAGFLLWHLLGRQSTPACHVTAGRRPPGATGPTNDVIVGASLARGLARAQARSGTRP